MRRGPTTAQRGLAGGHQGKRQAALAVLRDGDLCARCESRGIAHPMWRMLVSTGANGRLVAPLLDLDDFPGRRFGGPQIKRLSYRHCNRSHGARVGNRIKAIRRSALRGDRYDRWR